ncbi:hypothetical protein CWI37_1925p0010 [Hamiltosporidium tvaerminnensis]|uniref:Integrase zinc-binding domain-containing protein n=1 Tax=Hamiltosporidium tvaerminnensis TaxID=1176355 RepID=A0A4Q9KTF5_9MICR|nr:hypothetical protein CWI37_1925p0010 [Hamiltosporidium tvaerminnensis]
MLIDKVSFLKIIEEFDQAIISNKKENVAADFLSKILLKSKNIMEKYSYDIANPNEKYLYIDLKHKIIVPDDISVRLINQIHLILGHCGINRLYYSIKNLKLISNIKAKIKHIVNTCSTCMINKIQTISYEKITGFFENAQPLEKICSEILGPLINQFYKRKFYILRITDEIIFNQSRLDLLERTREINLESIATRIKQAADSENRKSNAKRKTEFVYEVGNFVLVKNHNRSKLDPFYIGPAKVVTMHRNNNVVTLSLHESYGKRTLKI